MAASKPSALKNRRVVTPDPGLFESTDHPTTPPTTAKPARLKRTYHLPRETIKLLENFQITERDRTDVKPELSDLVDTAIRRMVAAGTSDSHTSENPDTEESRSPDTKPS